MTTQPPPAREARATTPLTAREAAFVAAYRLHGHAAQAAREAGYAAHHATSIGWRLLHKPKIVAALGACGIEIALAPATSAPASEGNRAAPRRGLTLLQERFVFEYLIDGNGTQAAIRAGLPSKDPVRAGAKMLRKRAVARAIQRERAVAAARLGITVERVLGEQARIAFADIGDVADWGPDGVTLKEKTTVSTHDRAAIAELSSTAKEGAQGGAKRTHVRMHSKQHALDALARHLGLYGRGARTIANAAQADTERQDANAILRERLLRIARGGNAAAKKE